MQAEIIGEDEVDIGTKVIDNNGVEHQIEMHKSNGEIYSHHCDAYAEIAANRTKEENEHSNQARRFARYYVYLERGYDTVPAPENPVRIDAVRQAIADIDLAEFDSLFGDLYQQLAFEAGQDVSSVVDIPPEATDPCIYCQNVYLGLEPLETDLGKQLAQGHGLDTEMSAADIDVGDVSPADLAQWREFSDEFVAQAAEERLDLSETVYIEDTSAVYVKYPAGKSLTAADDHLEPAARDPDTVIELLPIDPKDIEYFKSFMDHYLRCQIRDSFVEMGVHPPEEFRVLGMGRFMSTWRYDNIAFYPRFHDPEDDAFN